MLDQTKNQEAKSVVSMLERLSRVLQASSYRAGLHPGQWSALRYFATSERGRRTVTGLACHQGTKVPPASRTVARLEAAGLLTVNPDPENRRHKLIDVTEAGYRMLAGDPVQDLERAVADLPQEERLDLERAISHVLGTLSPAEQMQTAI